MPSKKSPSISFHSVGAFFQKHLAYVVYIVTILIIGWLGYFIYSKVYTVTISPTPLDPSEIIARRQKVDVTRFNAVIEQIEAKQSQRTSARPLNPFE